MKQAGNRVSLIIRMCAMLPVLVMVAAVSFAAADGPGEAKKLSEMFPNQIGAFISGSAEISDIIDNSFFTPELHSIVLDPEIPAEGMPTRITVEVYNDPSLTDDETVAVYVIYTIDDAATWNYFELDTEDSRTWRGQFPRFEGGTDVIYAVRAVDSAYNVFTDVPCRVVPGDGLLSARYAKKDCVRSEDDPACAGVLPRGCMMKMAFSRNWNLPQQLETEPAAETVAGKITMDDIRRGYEEGLDPEYAESKRKSDIENSVSPPKGFKFFDLRVGYDEDYIYLDQAYKENLTGIGAFLTLSFNPDRVEKQYLQNPDKNPYLDAVGTLFYSPGLAQAIVYETAPCHYGYNRGIDYEQDAGSIECHLETNHRIFRVERAAFGANPGGELQFIVSMGLITGTYPFEWEILDNTPVTTIRMTGDNHFRVAEKQTIPD
ncbi:MAG TPA: hypothetical protein PLN69_11795 [bacterium]|nr:hypothetical protein [bacterium]